MPSFQWASVRSAVWGRDKPENRRRGGTPEHVAKSGVLGLHVNKCRVRVALEMGALQWPTNSWIRKINKQWLLRGGAGRCCLQKHMITTFQQAPSLSSGHPSLSLFKLLQRWRMVQIFPLRYGAHDEVWARPPTTPPVPHPHGRPQTRSCRLHAPQNPERDASGSRIPDLTSPIRGTNPHHRG